MIQSQLAFHGLPPRVVEPFSRQLLKWIGNKQRFAHEIVSYFPANFGKYYEPFLGSGAVLATLRPQSAIGSDAYEPLVGIWKALRRTPERLKQWYGSRQERVRASAKEAIYEQVRSEFNASPNAADLVYLCRSCYGGVVRFRQSDGFMSTPCGVHQPIAAASFAKRVDEWHVRCRGAEFMHGDFAEVMALAGDGDVVYCDPPYVDSQTILYGAQAFSLDRLFDAIEGCKARGAFVAMSIDGTKRSGDKICDVPIPPGLFEHEAAVNCGRSMLRRFQLAGKTLENEIVSDRLLLSYVPVSE